MTEASWMAEFYPIPADDRGLRIGPVSAVVRHSLQKWLGARPENLKRHGLEKPPVRFDAVTCALCVRFIAPDATLQTRNCENCPLYRVRGEVSCVDRRVDEDCDPLLLFEDYGDPEPMILWLERALEMVEKEETPR